MINKKLVKQVVKAFVAADLGGDPKIESRLVAAITSGNIQDRSDLFFAINDVLNNDEQVKKLAKQLT